MVADENAIFEEFVQADSKLVTSETLALKNIVRMVNRSDDNESKKGAKEEQGNEVYAPVPEMVSHTQSVGHLTLYRLKLQVSNPI